MQKMAIYELSDVELNRSRLDEKYAKSALRDYLKKKYGYSETQYLVLSDEPEPELVCDNKEEGKYPNIRSVYSGYRLATIALEDQRHYVKYSPLGDNTRYKQGGIDDIELESLTKDCTVVVADLLARFALERIVVNPGTRLSNRALALDSRYLEQNFFKPIPSDGIFNLQVVLEELPKSAPNVINEVIPFFDNCKSEILVDIMYRGYDTNGSISATLSHLYWHQEAS